MKGVQVQEVAKTLDTHPFMLSRWRKEYREGIIVAEKRKKVTNLQKEKKEMSDLKKLKAENAKLKQDNDLLKNGNDSLLRNTS